MTGVSMSKTKSFPEIMKALPLFSELKAGELEELAAKSALCSLKRGEILFSAGYPASHVYIVLFGSAKLVRAHPDGKERIVHLLLTGDMFGAAVALQGGFYPVSALALEQSSIMKIETKAFQEHFLRHPAVGKLLISQLGERLQQAHSDRVMSFDAVEKRIAIFLLELLERVQTISGATSRIPIPLTRQDIADRVGSTVETVIRVLSAWSKEKLVLTRDKYLEIPNAKALREILSLEF